MLKDTPMLAGQRVRIHEMRAIDFKDGGTPRRWFRIDTDYPKHSHVVVMGGLLKDGKMLCADHGIEDECDCKAAIRNYIRSDAA